MRLQDWRGPFLLCPGFTLEGSRIDTLGMRWPVAPAGRLSPALPAVLSGRPGGEGEAGRETGRSMVATVVALLGEAVAADPQTPSKQLEDDQSVAR